MNRAAILIAGALLLLLLPPEPTHAHPLRPGLLRLEAIPAQPGQLDVTLKLPGVGDRAAPVQVLFPPQCKPVTRPAATRQEDAVLQRWRVDCGEAGLGVGPIGFDDLSRKVGEVLVLVTDRHGETRSVVARADHPTVTLDADTQRGLASYIPLGVEHILLGIDHLLFVLGLMLLIFLRAVGRAELLTLLWTITAFTLAHSLTLAAATLGVIHVPSDATETVIALSILLLAVEVSRPADAPMTWTATRPASVAFAFGLLHGLGFAGALAEIGLPEDSVAGALLLFNVGVELGQLAFVATIGLLWWGLRGLPPRVLTVSRATVVHAIGAMAVYWSLDRGTGLLERLLSSSG